MQTMAFPTQTAKEYVRLYIRCLYCNNGQPETLLLLSWELGSELPEMTMSNHDEDFQGHHMRVISFPIEPFSSYVQSKNGPGGVVKLLDSFDKRLLEAMSSGMNFTYNVRSPKDMQTGYQLQNGSWTGVVGVLQKNEADFTTLIGTTSERTTVMDLTTTAYLDHMIITSLKPQLLPQYLVFFRPFTVDIWILLLFTVTIWASTLWFLEKVRSSFCGQKGNAFSEDLFYGWEIMLGNPTSGQSANSTRQMLVGWWLVVCFLMSTSFKSSLVAHLTVQGKTREINNCRDLVNQVNWAWGIDENYLFGLLVVTLKHNVDPNVRYVFEHHEKITTEDGLKKVLRGQYSFLSAKERVLEIIGSKYRNIYGQTPFYLGKEQYKASNVVGWGFRKGAPFKERLSKAITHLWESGISDRWLKEVRLANIKRNPGPTKEETELRMRAEINDLTVDSNVRILQTKHMLGVYVVLISGLSVALLAFVGEYLSIKICSACQEDIMDN
ncbi:probable glutamate receptor [Macrobrachium rosenbergii]|uniref:probable glutamate receptor n=1 Tax=Macrobrachium rosenbergii TaxID=79674 RepID=UPI0034D76EAD